MDKEGFRFLEDAARPWGVEVNDCGVPLNVETECVLNFQRAFASVYLAPTSNGQWLRLCVAFERYPELRRAYHHANRLRSSLARTHENRRRSHWMNGFGRPEPMAMPHSRAPQTVSVGTGKAS